MKRTLILTILGAFSLLAMTGGKSTETTSGILYNRNGQFSEALAILKKALAKDDTDWEAHFQIGYSYSQLDSVGLAYTHFMRAKELNPKKAAEVANNIQSNYAKHYKLGQAAFGRSDFYNAAHEFGTASVADPNQAAAHFNCAVAYSRLAEKDSTYAAKTLEESERALELSAPTDANYDKALSLVGRQLVALDRVDEAPARFEKLMTESPGSYQVLEDIGNDAMDRRRWNGAAVFLKMTAEARAAAGEESYEVYFNAGTALYNLGRQVAKDPAGGEEAAVVHFDEAIVYYEKALNVQPDDAPSVLGLVAVTMVKKDWNEAALWGEKYVSVSPGDPKGWQSLGRIYTELGETDKATDARLRLDQLRSAQTE